MQPTARQDLFLRMAAAAVSYNGSAGELLERSRAFLTFLVHGDRAGAGAAASFPEPPYGVALTPLRPPAQASGEAPWPGPEGSEHVPGRALESLGEAAEAAPCQCFDQVALGALHSFAFTSGRCTARLTVSPRLCNKV